MFYMAANISSMLNVKWFMGMFIYKKNPPPLRDAFFFSTLGIPFNDTVNWRLEIAEKGQQILGDNLLGLQAGNEPDYYAAFVSIFLIFSFPSFFYITFISLSKKKSFLNLFRNGHRPPSYGPQDYSNEIGSLIKAMEASGIPNKNIIIGPSVASGNWRPEQVWDIGFIDKYSDNLAGLSVEQ